MVRAGLLLHMLKVHQLWDGLQLIMDAADYPLISPAWVTHVSRLPMASLMRIGWSPYLRITLRQATESRRLGGSTFERRLSVKSKF